MNDGRLATVTVYRVSVNLPLELEVKVHDEIHVKDGGEVLVLYMYGVFLLCFLDGTSYTHIALLAMLHVHCIYMYAKFTF